MEHAGTPGNQKAEAQANTEMKARIDLVYEAICKHWKDHSFPPTIRDVANATGIPSTSNIAYYYQKLAQDGRIVMSRSHPVPSSLFHMIKDWSNHVR